MEKLSRDLISIGEELSHLPSTGPLDVRVLTILKRAKLVPYLSQAYEAEKRFFAFFLINFLDDVFYNLVGDFPYDKPYGEKAHGIKLDFFKDAGRDLSAIGEALSRSDFQVIYNHFVSLVTLYLDKIDEINRLIETETEK